MIQADRNVFAGNVIPFRRAEESDWLGHWSTENQTEEKLMDEQYLSGIVISRKSPFSDGRRTSLLELEQRLQEIRDDLRTTVSKEIGSSFSKVEGGTPVYLYFVPIIITIIPVFSSILAAALLYEFFLLYNNGNVIGAASAGVLIACLSVTYAIFKMIVRKLRIEAQ